MSIPAQGAVGAETMTAGQSLDLRDLHAANIARQAEWCPDQVPDLSFRGNELGGECGEAQNVIKKLERERHGWRGSRATKDDLADELADVVICADLCAVTADIDLGAAVRRKFNATSEKQGLSVFLPLPALASPRADSDERTAGEEPWGIEEADGRIWVGPLARDGAKVDAFVFEMDIRDIGPEAQERTRADARRVVNAINAISAQPAGAVPDSLQEAATDLIAHLDRAPIFMLPAATGASVNRLRTLLASHPAGQSAGTGAEAVKWGSANTVGELMAQLRTLPADAKIFGTFKGPDDKGDDYRTGVRGVLLSRERVRGRWIRTQDKEAPYEHVIWTVPEPAPESTRTGQGEAIARAAYVRICRHDSKEGWQHAGADFDRREEDGGCYVNALELALAIGSDAAEALAARPAAPEAQGAWLPIETAPRDGSKFDAWAVDPSTGSMGVRFADVQMRGDGSGFGIVIHQGDAHWEYLERQGPTFPAWKLTHWRRAPAPPAPSGQGGR